MEICARILTPFLSLLLLALGPVAALRAQAAKIFVASYGNDANDGSRGTPERNFQAAHDAVAAGGQIVVLDTAGYGALSINKSISVTVPPGVNGFISVSGNSASGIVINAAGTDSVTLRGLIIEGGGNGIGDTGSGILANSIGNLAIEDCTVRNFSEGIYLLSTASAKIYVRHSTLRGCGYGLDVENGSGSAASATAIASECVIDQCTIDGVVALPSSAGSVDLTLADCIISGNKNGLRTAGSLSTASVIRVDNCRITGNASGVVVQGGQILSRGNNKLEKNANNNAFPATYSAK